MDLEYNINYVALENRMLRLFRERTAAELKLALEEVRSWNDRVARGLVKSEHAQGYIGGAKNIIATKRRVLSFFECRGAGGVGEARFWSLQEGTPRTE